LKTVITLLSAIVFCGIHSISLAASPAAGQSSNQLTNQAMETLQKNQAAAGQSSAKPASKPKAGATSATKKLAKTPKGNVPLNIKNPHLVVKTYQTDLKTQTKDSAQYQKDVNAATALFSQIKNNQPTLAQAQALQKLHAQILTDQTKYTTDQKTMAKDTAEAKAAAAALKAEEGKKPSTASLSQPSGKAGAAGGNGAPATTGGTIADKFDTQALLQIVNDGAKGQKAQSTTAATASGQTVSIADMFQMQMLMNHFSQASEMSGAVLSAQNSAVENMSRSLNR